MKRNRKSTYFSSLLAAAMLVFGVSQNTALAQEAGPLAEILERLDTFVEELEGIDVQTEELENPSFEDKMLDAMEMELCGQWKLVGAELELTMLKVGDEAEFGIGLGPNFMGTGLAVKLEPKLEAELALASQTEASIATEVCVDIFKLAKIIRDQNEAAEAGALPVQTALGAGLDPLEGFVNQLTPDARDQILDFADQFTVDLLELIVLLLEGAGIDPAAPESLADSLLAPVEAIGTYAMDMSPENILDLNRASEIAASIPFGAQLQTAFTGGIDALSSFGVEDINPCGDIEFLPGLEDLRDAVCGIEPLYTNSAGYLEQLGGALGDAADELSGLASDVEDEVEDLETDLTTLFGGLKTMFNSIDSKVCKSFGHSITGGIWPVYCKASVSFNPCNVTSLKISIGCWD